MNTTVIICIAVIVVLLIVIAYMLGKKKPNESNTESSITTTMKPAKESLEPIVDVEKLSEVSELLIKNELGNEIVFKRPESLRPVEYKEITINRGGQLAQHVGEAAFPIAQQTYTVKKLQEMAPNGLFTSQIPKSQLSRYKTDGSFSSVLYKKGMKGVQGHTGYLEVDMSPITALNKANILNASMQGMAAISGQYYMKQIVDGLNSLDKRVERLENHTKNKDLGCIYSGRKRLMEICQKEFCTIEDVNEIRDIARDADKILEAYKITYNQMYEELMDFKSGELNNSKRLDEYSKRLGNLKFTFAVCCMSERIVEDAKLAEIITRLKANIDVQAANELYRELEDRSVGGFNAKIRPSIHETFNPLLENANEVINGSFFGDIFMSEEGKKQLIKPISTKVKDLKSIAVDLTDSAYLKEDVVNKDQDVVLMIDEETGETRTFVPVLD